jgi:hypothetical protein
MQHIRWDDAYVVGLSMVPISHYLRLRAVFNDHLGWWHRYRVHCSVPSPGQWQGRPYCICWHNRGMNPPHVSFQPSDTSSSQTTFHAPRSSCHHRLYKVFPPSLPSRYNLFLSYCSAITDSNSTTCVSSPIVRAPQNPRPSTLSLKYKHAYIDLMTLYPTHSRSFIYNLHICCIIMLLLCHSSGQLIPYRSSTIRISAVL